MSSIPVLILILSISLLSMCVDHNGSSSSTNIQEVNISKQLYIIRHGKSSWKDDSLHDFDRPLKARGENDARIMGKLLKSKNILPDLIISSPANRAISTAYIIADEIGYPKEQIQTDRNMYHPSVSDVLEILEGVDETDISGKDTIKSVMIFGHNPGFTMLANYLTDDHFDKVPTCGIVAVGFQMREWKSIQKNSGQVIFYETPKKYRDE